MFHRYPFLRFSRFLLVSFVSFPFLALQFGFRSRQAAEYPLPWFGAAESGWSFGQSLGVPQLTAEGIHSDISAAIF